MGRVSDAKKRLLEAAKGLIWEQSYGAVTVDAICRRAKVQKGSFYHFFDDKSELAVASLEADWQARQPVLAEIFSRNHPPLDRLQNFFEHVYQCQKKLQKECGYVLGCPLFNLGSEVCTRDEKIRKKVLALVKGYIRYFESSIRDAQEEGSVAGDNAGLKARWLFSYFEGALTQARIENDASSLRSLGAVALHLLDAKLAMAA